MGAIDQAKRILIVDRDVISMEPLRQALSAAGLAVRTVAGDAAAIEALTGSPPDLAIVDWEARAGSGADFVWEVLRLPSPGMTRLIIASALSEEQDVVRGLGIGADDYLVKPFSPREAVARVLAVLRTRSRVPAAPASLVCDELELDASTSRVMARGRSVHLRGVEYRLLEFLMTHPGRTFNRTQLLAQVWGGDSEVDERTVDVNVQRLRKTLGEPGCGTYIRTVRGFGYCFMRPG